MNWNHVNLDNVSRHLRITNRLNQTEYVKIDHIRPLLPHYLFFHNKHLQRLLGTDNMFAVRMEDSNLLISSLKPEYAINKNMLRAVLNGYSVDMTVPITLHRQDRTMASKLRMLS